MAIKFDKVTAGMTLYDVHRHKVGNVRGRSELGCWPVLVVSTDTVRQTALVRWNNNAPETWSAKRVSRLYRKPPPSYEKQRRA